MSLTKMPNWRAQMPILYQFHLASLLRSCGWLITKRVVCSTQVQAARVLVTCELCLTIITSCFCVERGALYALVFIGDLKLWFVLFGFAEIKGAKISLHANLPTSGQQIMGFAECKELVCVLGETSDGQRPSLICFCLKTGVMLVHWFISLLCVS